ncbi:MAG TPA: ribose-phosphate pyrophosphokinase [Egibacteraceae bacterium]|nr:ribose-phosphate pyrophosphokinase [Egibacteraceae bacterium]
MQLSSDKVKLFAGTANPVLAGAIARTLGLPLGALSVGRFPDGEVKVRLEESVRGDDVYVVQSTCPPVDSHLMELLTLVDALRRSSAGRINAVIPYFGYARQDKQVTGREPITAKLVANLLESAGVDRVITVDLHARQVQGFFDVPVDQLSALRTMSGYLRQTAAPNTVVVSPDTGRGSEARRLADMLGLPLALLYKRRHSDTETEVTAVIGDVAFQRVLLVDDVISTGGTLRRAVEALLENGAVPDIRICATHAVLAGDARQYLSHDAIKEVIVTDTIPLRPGDPYTVLSIAPLIASAIYHVHTHQSVSSLF